MGRCDVPILRLPSTEASSLAARDDDASRWYETMNGAQECESRHQRSSDRVGWW